MVATQPDPGGGRPRTTQVLSIAPESSDFNSFFDTVAASWSAQSMDTWRFYRDSRGPWVWRETVTFAATRDDLMDIEGI
jgi:hypothetical protein